MVNFMTVTIIPQAVENGKTVEGTPYDVEVIRVQESKRTLQNKQGSQVQASSKFFFSPETEISSSHKILYNSRKLEILTFYPAFDIDGNLDHYEVTV